jgi:hypothetical protein
VPVDSKVMGGGSELVVYECSGLTIASEIPLAAPMSTLVDPAGADVTVVLGAEVDQPFERPSADLVAELAMEDYLCYTICRVGDGYVARLPWIADFVIDGDLRRVECRPALSRRADVIPIIISGTITAFLLAMGGRCVLHGSAVDLGGRAVGFVGVSGQGKSTMAAVFCAAGAGLVTDDVLPLEFDDEGVSPGTVSCVRSGHEIRLREKASSLADRFGDRSVRITQDERHAVAPQTSPLERLPLAGIVLPRPNHHDPEVTSRRLEAGEASLALGRCQRIEGWQGRDHLRQQFVDIGRVVGSVPVFEVSVPWGPPFADDLAQRTLQSCGLDDLLSVAGSPPPA